jgi:hypothetical protein
LYATGAASTATHASDVGDDQQDRQQRGRRAQIGLARDDQERHRRQSGGNEKIVVGERRTPFFAEHLGQHQRQRGLGELRRLQVERAEIEPAARSAAHLSEEQHADEQDHHRQIDPVRLVGERAIVDAHRKAHRDQPDPERVNLGPVDAAGAAGGAEDHREADRADREHRADQHPVDVVIETPLEHQGVPPGPVTAATRAGVTAGVGGGGGTRTGSGSPSRCAK